MDNQKAHEQDRDALVALGWTPPGAEDKYAELIRVLDSVGDGLVCTICAYQMFEVAFHAADKLPERVFKSCDLLTAVQGASKMATSNGET